MRRSAIAGLVLLAGTFLRGDDYADLFRQAAADTQQGRYQMAIAKYKAALAIRPGSPEALNNLAVMLYETGQYEAAFETSAIWRTDPALHSAALIAGMSAVRLNRPKDAIEPLTHVLDRDSRNRDALLALASARLSLQQFSEAAAVYQKETESSPNDVTAWYGRAICFEQLAERASRRLAQMPGGASYSKRLLAEYLQSEGDIQLAREAFGDAEKTGGTESPQAAREYHLARELARQSRESFEELVTIAPESWESLVFLGDVDRQGGKLQAAIAQYQKAAEIQPGNPAPLLGLGTAYWELGDLDRASTYLEQTLKLNPEANQAVFELANIAIRRHDEKRAIFLLKRYLAAQPDALAAHGDLGRAYLHLGQFQEAVTELSRAAPGDERGEVHYQLSVALRKLRRTKEADEALKASEAIRQAQLAREERLHSVK
jgi:tetratricopeptide (TPR) repeat protein